MSLNTIKSFWPIGAKKNPAGDTAGQCPIMGGSQGNNIMAASLFKQEPVGEPRLVDIIQPGRMAITPALARRILDEANYVRQRVVYKSSIQNAVNLINGAAWVDGHQIWFVRVGDELFLVDGQHRMSGVWQTGATKVFTVEIVPGNSMDDVHAEYARFDRFGRKRTDAEMLTSVGFGERVGISKLMARAAYNAAPILQDNFGRARYGNTGPLCTDAAKLDYLREWEGLIPRYAEAIKPASVDVGRALLNPGIVAVGLLTLRDQATSATDFWSGVALNDGLRRGDPRHTMVGALMNRSFNRTGGDGARMAAVAWNAYYEGRRLTFIRITEGADVRLSGVRKAGK